MHSTYRVLVGKCRHVHVLAVLCFVLSYAIQGAYVTLYGGLVTLAPDFLENLLHATLTSIGNSHNITVSSHGMSSKPCEKNISFYYPYCSMI